MESYSIGIVGGPDGPTEVFAAGANATSDKTSFSEVGTAKDAPGTGYKMSIGEAAVVSVVSISIVMAILFIISTVLGGFNRAYNRQKKKEDALRKEEEKRLAEEAAEIEEVIEEEAAEPDVEEVMEIAEEDTLKDTEIVAVIMAAVAASMKTTTDKIVIKSIRKRGSWKNTALRENFNRV